MTWKKGLSFFLFFEINDLQLNMCLFENKRIQFVSLHGTFLFSQKKMFNFYQFLDQLKGDTYNLRQFLANERPLKLMKNAFNSC